MGYSIVENDCMSQNYLEDFCSVAPYVFLNAEEELARMGDGAIPVLLTFFAGSARNSAGVPYRAVSARAMRCAFATVCRLGAAAKPLEGILRAELKDGDLMCADALFALGSLEEKTIDVLAACLRDPASDVAWQATHGFIRCGFKDHPAFIEACSFLVDNDTIASRRLLAWING